MNNIFQINNSQNPNDHLSSHFFQLYPSLSNILPMMLEIIIENSIKYTKKEFEIQFREKDQILYEKMIQNLYFEEIKNKLSSLKPKLKANKAKQEEEEEQEEEQEEPKEEEEPERRIF